MLINKGLDTLGLKKKHLIKPTKCDSTHENKAVGLDGEKRLLGLFQFSSDPEVVWWKLCHHSNHIN